MLLELLSIVMELLKTFILGERGPALFIRCVVRGQVARKSFLARSGTIER